MRSNLKNLVSAAEKVDKPSLTKDPNFIEPEESAEETNIESLTGMLDNLCNEY